MGFLWTAMEVVLALAAVAIAALYLRYRLWLSQIPVKEVNFFTGKLLLYYYVLLFPTFGIRDNRGFK
jgi:hypothetical protein